MHKKILHQQAGFTLIELILYVALSALFVSASISFALNLIYSGARSENQQEVVDAVMTANQKITQALQEADGYTVVSPTELSLSFADSARNPTVFTLSSGQIFMGEGTSGSCTTTSPCAITPDSLSVTALEFTDTSSSPDSENITFSMTLQKQGDRSEWNYIRSSESSIELRN